MPDPDPAQPAIVPGLWGIAGQEPDRPALIVPGGETVTFGGLAAATHRLANLLDRRDDLIITGGVNVYPAEVEQRLIVHPAVADVAVVGIGDLDWGHRVVAVVELEDGWASGDQLEAELDAHCRATLASLKCPDRYEFRQSLPRTASGKLLRRVIRQEMSEEANGPVQH